jgi:hypothetical protein
MVKLWLFICVIFITIAPIDASMCQFPGQFSTNLQINFTHHIFIKSSAEKVRKQNIFIFIYVKLALRYQFEKICTDNNEPGEQHSSLKGKKQRKSFRKVIKTSISCRKHVSVCNIFASEGSSRKTTFVQRPASQSSSV